MVFIISMVICVATGLILKISGKKFSLKFYLLGCCISLLITFGLPLLVGCSTQKTKVVKVPVVAKAKKIEIPKKPYLPIADLTKESSPDVVMKSYVASLKLTQGYSVELRKTLEAYQ